jgi:hypothetical protein
MTDMPWLSADTVSSEFVTPLKWESQPERCKGEEKRARGGFAIVIKAGIVHYIRTFGSTRVI